MNYVKRCKYRYWLFCTSTSENKRSLTIFIPEELYILIIIRNHFKMKFYLIYNIMEIIYIYLVGLIFLLELNSLISNKRLNKGTSTSRVTGFRCALFIHDWTFPFNVFGSSARVSLILQVQLQQQAGAIHRRNSCLHLCEAYSSLIVTQTSLFRSIIRISINSAA